MCDISPGYGGLSLSIEGPSKAEIDCHDNEDGSCKVTYKPTEPGNYIVNVKFADEHVPGTIKSFFLDNFLSLYKNQCFSEIFNFRELFSATKL